MLKYTDVFVPGGFPRHTYNPRESLSLETQLGEVRENLCKLVTITGHTKSGKTVLTRRILPPEKSVWIDGGVVANEEDFWSIVLDNLELFQDTTTGAADNSSSTIHGKGSAGANFLVAKGEGEVGAAYQSGRSSSATHSRKVSSRIAALNGLRARHVSLVIDDFHYLPKDLQGNIVRALKPLIFDGLPVVVIAIPHRRYDAIKVEKEMTGRILPLSIPVWSEDELVFIPQTGFPLIGQKVEPNLNQRLAQEAIGSPHLMQEFCRAIAKSGQQSLVSSDIFGLEKIFRDVAETIGRPIFEKLARGPRQRTDRVRRQLKSGREVDIYQLVLHGLAHLKPGLVTLEYEDLRAGIRDVSGGQIPQLHEVTRVLKHMATIAATDQSSTPVIDFEEGDKRLHVTDPFFAFYLRWGDLSNS
ncbi:ATP-binding protein [Pseudomonas stutzeri]|nr:ATP-binding protein [Stutzerimonas stutzeri]